MRYKIYKALKESNGFVSGETLSTALGITRAALWKHIKAMQEDGAVIESTTGMGYRLLSSPNIARVSYLRAHIQCGAALKYQKSVTSTNDVAKQAALTDKVDNAVFIAGEQTAGKGRKGRKWHSPPGGGIYMSFLVRPKIDMTLVSGLTLMAAIALCDAIEQTADVSVGIKWPNDVMIDGRKRHRRWLIEHIPGETGFFARDFLLLPIKNKKSYFF